MRNDAAEGRVLASIIERGIQEPLKGVDVPEGRRLLEAWDGRVAIGSAGASVYELFVLEMRARMVRAKAPSCAEGLMGRGFSAITPTNVFWRTSHLVRLVREQPRGCFERGWSAEMEEALAAAVRRLRARGDVDYESLPFFEKVLDTVHHLILPLITLTSAGIAMFYKYMKDSMAEVLGQTFIINLTSDGLDENTIIKRHVIPNSLRPLISVAGVELGILLGGTLITEVIFSLPGMGRLTIESILSRDYTLVIGCVFTAGAVMIAANFLADIIKLRIDKRLIKGILN